MLNCFFYRGCFELMLQRTIVHIMNAPPHLIWFNEFNIASGLNDGDRKYSRFAVDLRRVRKRGYQHRLDLFELKEWSNKADNLDDAAIQIFRYATLYVLLCARGIAPYDEPPHNDLNSVRVSVIGPADYFRTHGHPIIRYKENGFFRQYYDAVESLKKENPELSILDVRSARGDALHEIDRTEFRELFFDNGEDEGLDSARTQQLTRRKLFSNPTRSACLRK